MKASLIASLLVAPACAFVPSFSGATLRTQRLAARPHASKFVMSEGNSEESLKKKIAAVGAAAALAFGGLFGNVGDAMAAQSGGRVGGGSFRSAPSRSSGGGGGSRSYSAPRSYGGRSGGGGVNLNVYPGVSSFGFSPFGFSPFGFSPFGYSPLVAPLGPSVAVYRGGWGFNPIDLLLLGGAFVAVRSLLRGGVERSWDESDDFSSALGSGVSVVKLQVAMICPDRGRSSILAQLQDLAGRADTNTGKGLASAASEAALALVRRQSDWVAAGSDYKHFGGGSADRAERQFNTFAVETRSKVERETVARVGGRDVSVARSGGGGSSALVTGRPTLAVVTLVVALKGDSLKAQQLERSVNTAAGLRKALTQLAADAMADDGEAVMAAELLWTPEEPWDTLDKETITRDFPELIDV